MDRQEEESKSFNESNWSDHVIVEWILEHKQFILWSLAGFFILLLFALKLTISHQSTAENDYAKAEMDFHAFEKSAFQSEKTSNKGLVALENLMNQYPELHAKYDAILAQILIAKNNPKAKTFAEATFARTDTKALDLYHVFAKNSLLINEQNYSAALSESLKLKKIIAKDTSDVMLQLFNLLRIAVLQKKIGDKVAEKDSWEEFQKLIKQNKESSFVDLFDRGNISLAQYIQKRKTAE